MNELAQRVRQLSVDLWGEGRDVQIEGDDPKLSGALHKLEKFAAYEFPLLITGESGVGKELFAKAFYLLSSRRGHPFTSVNCPQYQDGNLTVSELFGHKKGSFTGAASDHKGLFESADGGMVFLDEIGDLHIRAQVMLLRFLAEGEFFAVGSTERRAVNVRVIAATNLDLLDLVAEGKFRLDLFYRLRYFRLRVPPVRERGSDWKCLCNTFLRELNQRHGVEKHFSAESYAVLQNYSWPGNIREIKSIVTIAFSASSGNSIEPTDFLEELEGEKVNGGNQLSVDDCYRRMLEGGESFWQVVHDPFMDRELNRSQVKKVVCQGLAESKNSYKVLLKFFRIPEDQYLKFMDFLRHHRLKP